MFIKNRILLFLFLILLPINIFASKITLKDGQTLDGKVLGTKNGIITIETRAGKIKLKEEQIEKIDLEYDLPKMEKAGDEYFEQGKYEKALEEYEKAFLEDNSSMRLLKKINAVKAKLAAGKKEEAKLTSPEKVLKKAKSFQDKVRSDEAKKVLEKGLKDFPESQEIMLELSKIYKGEGNIEYFVILRKLIDRWPEQYYNVFSAELFSFYKKNISYYSQTGDYDSAEDALFNALSFSTDMSEPAVYEDYIAFDFDDIEKKAMALRYLYKIGHKELTQSLKIKYWDIIKNAFNNNEKKYYPICADIFFYEIMENSNELLRQGKIDGAIAELKKAAMFSSDLYSLNSFDDYAKYKSDSVYQIAAVVRWASASGQIDILGVASKELLSIDPEDEKGWENVSYFINNMIEAIMKEFNNKHNPNVMVTWYKELEKFRDLAEQKPELKKKLDDVKKLVLNEQEAAKMVAEAQEFYKNKKYYQAKLNCDYILRNLGAAKAAVAARELEVKCDLQIGYNELFNDASSAYRAADYYGLYDLAEKIESDYTKALAYDAEAIENFKTAALTYIFEDTLLEAQRDAAMGDLKGACELLGKIVFRYSQNFRKPYWDAERLLSEYRKALSNDYKSDLTGKVFMDYQTSKIPMSGVKNYIVFGEVTNKEDIPNIIRGRGYVDSADSNKEGFFEIKKLPVGQYTLISIIGNDPKRYVFTQVDLRRAAANRIEVTFKAYQ